MDQQHTAITAAHGAMASLPAEATSISTPVLRIPTPEFCQFCDSCKLAFSEYQPFHGRIARFCAFCGLRLFRVMSIEERVLPRIVLSAHPASVVDTPIGQRPSPPPTRVESSNVGHSSKSYPSLGYPRGSSPPDERSDALNRSSEATHRSFFAQDSTSRRRSPGPRKRRNMSNDWQSPHHSTNPSVQSTNELKLEPASTISVQPLFMLQDTLPNTRPLAQPVAESMDPPLRPAIPNDSSNQQQNPPRELPKYDFSRWQAYETDRPTQPAPVPARGRGPWLTPIMERENMTIFQRFAIPKKVKKLEKRAEKLRQQIRAKEFVNSLAGSQREGQEAGDIQGQTRSTVERGVHHYRYTPRG